jgi:hypothetical protein
MKIALITGGQPRFTPDFVTLLSQIQGMESADIYMNLWNSDWAKDEDEARKKVEKILPDNFNLAKIKLTDQPSYELPTHTKLLPPPEPENIQWWYKRKIGQMQSLSMAFNLIDQEYDAVIRFRLDGRLDRVINVNEFDLVNNDMIMPEPRVGREDFPICDQFFIGTYSGVKFLCDLVNDFNKYVVLSDPNWDDNTHHGVWSLEHIIGAYYLTNNKQVGAGGFNTYINTQGRSRYTDKHYHHGITSDPTS